MANTPTLQSDQIADVLVSLPGVSVDMFSQIVGGTYSVSDTVNFQPFDASFTQTFTAPVAGTYLLVINGSMYGNGGGAGARLRLKFDHGLAGEQIVGADDATWAIQLSASFHEARSWVAAVELSAGQHTLRPECKKLTVYGASDPAVDANSSWLVRGVLISGSGAGGTIASRKVTTGNTVSTLNPTFTTISELTTSFRTAEGEQVLLVLSGYGDPDTASSTTLRIDVKIDGVVQAQFIEADNVGKLTSINLAQLSTPLAAGPHTATVEIAHDVNTWQFETGNVFSVIQFRGGLVPVELNGAEVTASPRALNFKGAGLTVSDVDGKADIELPVAVTASGDLVVLADDTQANATINSGTWTKFTPSTAGHAFVPKVTGQYRVDMALQWSSTNVAGSGVSTWRLRVKIDDGVTPIYVDGANTGDGQWAIRTSENTFQPPYQQASFFDQVSLVAGTAYTITAEAMRVDGLDEIQLDTGASSTHIALQSVSGSGAGGTIVIEKELLAPYSSSAAHEAWQDIDNGGGDALSVTFNATAGESVLVLVKTTCETTAGAGGSLFARLVVNGTPIAGTQIGENVTTDDTANILVLPFVVTGLLSGPNTIKVQGRSSSGADTWEWIREAGTGNTDRGRPTLQVFQFRGGLVPVRADGALITDKPLALDFLGADVSESGGAAVISLPAAVTAPATPHVLTDGQPASDINIAASPTYTQVAPEAGSFSIVVDAETTFIAALELCIFNSTFTGSKYKLVFDEGQANEQTVGDNDGWQARISGNDHGQPSFRDLVTLSAGTHTVKAYGTRVSGSGTPVVLGVAQPTGAPIVTLTPCVGSGAGGVIKTNAELQADFNHTGGNSWLDVDNGSGDSLLLTFNTQANEDVLIILRMELRHTSGSSFEGAARLDIDSGTIFGGMGDDATTAAGGNTKLTIDRTWVYRFATAGQHTVQVQAFSSAAIIAGINAQVSAIQFRGGLVPIKGDGVTKLDKPAALNFKGASVTNQGGVADIELPTAVTAAGASILAIIDALADQETLLTTETTFSTIETNNLETTFVAPVAGKYLFILKGQIRTVTSNGADARFRLKFDEAGYNGFTEQDIGGGAGDQVSGTPDQNRIGFSNYYYVDLEVGTHKVAVQWCHHSGIANIETPGPVKGPWKLDAFAITGSGAGGVLADRAVLGSDSANTSSVSLVSIPAPGPLTLSFDTTDEKITVGFDALAINQQAGVNTPAFKLKLDGVEIGEEARSVIDGGVAFSVHLSRTVDIQVAAGTHTLELFTRSLNTLAFNVGGETAIYVRQYRGGLVPVRADGVTKLTAPAALDFINAEVTNQAGVAKINLLGAEGASTDKATLASDQTIVATTDAPIPNTPLTLDFEANPGEVVLIGHQYNVTQVSGSPNDYGNLYVDGILASPTTNLRASVGSGAENQAVFFPYQIPLSAGTSHTLELQAHTLTSTSWSMLSGASIFVTRFKGGYVLPENIPVFERHSSDTSVVNANAALGASSTGRMALSDGQQRTAALPLTCDLDTTGEGGRDATESLSTGLWHIFAVETAADTTKFALVASKSATPGTSGPSSHTIYKYLWTVRETNGTSSDIEEFRQAGNRYYPKDLKDTAWRFLDDRGGTLNVGSRTTGAWQSGQTAIAAVVPNGVADEVLVHGALDLDVTGQLATIAIGTGNPPSHTPTSPPEFADTFLTGETAAADQAVRLVNDKWMPIDSDGEIQYYWQERTANGADIDAQLIVHGYRNALYPAAGGGNIRLRTSVITRYEQELVSTGTETEITLTATPAVSANDLSGYAIKVYRNGKRMRYQASRTTNDHWSYNAGTNKVEFDASGSADEYHVEYWT